MKHNYFLKFLVLIFISFAFGKAMGQTPIFSPGMNISVAGSVNSPSGEGVSKIIDANNNTKFLDFNYSDGMGFTVYMGGTPYVASSIEITTANDSPNRDPQNYQILGSNDGSAFTTVATGNIPCTPSRFLKRSFSFSNTNPYKYYRIIFTTQCGPDNSLQIAETQLLGTEFNEAPVAVCKDFTAQLDGSGNVSILPGDVDGGSSDDKEGLILSLNKTTFDCSTIGENSVELTVTDSDGVKDTCTATVTIEDNVAPTVNTQDVTVYLDENEQASITGDYTVGPVAGQLEPQNSVSTTATVDCDCPEGYVAVGYEGFSGWILDDFRLMCKEVLADGSLGTEIIETCFSGSQTSLGNTKVLNGNEVLVGFQVIDGDYQSQQSSRTHVSVQGYGKSLKEVARGRLNSTENTVLGAISGSGTGTSNFMTTTKFAPAGQAIVGMSVNQTSGYSSSVSFKYAPINTLLSINDASFDNCEIASISADVYDFTCEDVGENTVTLTVTDVNGNQSSATATVTVEDNTTPTAIAKDITVQLDENGMAFITPEMIDNGSSDNCTNPDALSFSLDKTEFSCENVESNNPSAIDFISENNSYFSTDATANIPVGTQERTISLWVNPDVSDFCWGCLVQQGNGDCTSKMFGLGMNENNKLVFWGGCDDYISNLDIPNDTWTYIAVTFKNGLVTLYANGESESFSKPNINTTSSKLFVGRETVNNGASFRENFDGQIDEVRIYDRALNELEVEEDKASLAPLNGVVSSYTFDDKNGTDINDEEGNNNGTLVGSNGENFVEGILKQNQVALTVTDQNGNSATATAIVTVEDNIAAEVLTQDITVQLDELGMATISPEMIDNGSNDACGIESLGLDITDFTCENIGENTVTLRATDVNGNESSATAVVTVEDNIAAEVLTQNITVQLDELGMASITPEMIDNGSNDTCGIESLGLDITDFICENIGENTVTLTATDVNGNESSATATVTVEDNVAPKLETQPITVQLDANGVASITPADIDNGSSDNCEIDTMSLDITEFSCEDVDNPVTVTLTVIDVNGNESSATATVTVEDNVAPIVETQPITVQLDANGVASITPEDIDKGSSDNCEIDTMSLDITEFSCSDVDNPVTVTLTVIDVNGNESSASATVTVEDNVVADAVAKDITVQLDEAGNATITAEDVDNGSNDACGITSMSVSPNTFTCAEVGENTVTLTVVDNNGNESTTTSTVTVEDNVAATVTTKNITVELDANGMASITPAMIDNDSNDACGIESLVLDITDFTCENVGDNTVTLIATDINGNESSATATVIVEDNVAPVPDVAELEDVIVKCEVVAGRITAPTATDNCGVLTATTLDPVTYNQPASYTITWNFDDGNGNTAMQTQNVIVEPSPLNALTFEDASFVYDGSEHTLEVKNLPAGASVDYTISSETGTENRAVNAGVYTVTANLSSGSETCPDTELTATLTILKAEAMITADATQTFTYDGTVKNVVAALNHSESALTYTPEQGFTEVGIYPITISSAETENYLATTKEVSLVIEKAEITGVTFEGNTEPFVYNGNEHSIFVTGLPEDATVTYVNNARTNAGTYAVTATVSQPGYEDLVLTANMLIEKASQSITFNEIEALDQQTDEYLQLDAISTSGLPVMYSYTYETENPAATVGPRGFVRILGGGQITITATQAGNQNYEAAAPVVRTLTIQGAEARLVNAVINGVTYSNPGEDIYYLIGCGNSEDEVQIQLEQNLGSTIDRANSFTMSTPAPGIYKETVIVTSEDGNSTKTYHITVEKNFNFEDIVVQKFNNVLLVNNNPETNGGYKFVGYRWYKDGSVIGSGQYYSAGDNADDQLDADSSYYVVLETEDGEFLRTCTSAIQLRSSLNVALAPNPVSSGGTMELLADFPKDELETMSLSIHNLNGMLIKQMKSNNKRTNITLPYNLEMGVYILKIETKNIHKSLKFIIK